jgi:uncharacterized damage-inducible protein DinB
MYGVGHADERDTLLAFLDLQRAEAQHLLEGLTDEQAKERLVPSLTTPAGVVAHLAVVERFWFRRILDGQDWTPPWTEDDPDPEWRVGNRTVADILADYAEAVAQSEEITARHQLEDVAVARDAVTLRWILVHMIEETARHNGHLDILREQLDARG